jgi:hypothetical protein
MEARYRKNSKGRYEVCGYETGSEISEGIWMVQSKPSSKSTTSLVWKVGDLKRPVDVVTIAALESFNDDLTRYLMKLTEEGSDELKEAKEILGGYMYGAVQYGNISASDLCSLFLRRIAMECEETKVPKSWNALFYEFRKAKGCTNEEVSFLYKLEDWLKEKNYRIKL